MIGTNTSRLEVRPTYENANSRSIFKKPSKLSVAENKQIRNKQNISTIYWFLGLEMSKPGKKKLSLYLGHNFRSPKKISKPFFWRIWFFLSGKDFYGKNFMFKSPEFMKMSEPEQESGSHAQTKIYSKTFCYFLFLYLYFLLALLLHQKVCICLQVLKTMPISYCSNEFCWLMVGGIISVIACLVGSLHQTFVKTHDTVKLLQIMSR